MAWVSHRILNTGQYLGITDGKLSYAGTANGGIQGALYSLPLASDQSKIGAKITNPTVVPARIVMHASADWSHYLTMDIANSFVNLSIGNGFGSLTAVGPNEPTALQNGDWVYLQRDATQELFAIYRNDEDKPIFTWEDNLNEVWHGRGQRMCGARLQRNSGVNCASIDELMMKDINEVINIVNDEFDYFFDFEFTDEAVALPAVPPGVIGINAPVPNGIIIVTAPKGLISILAPIPSAIVNVTAPPGLIGFAAPVPVAMVKAIAPPGIINLNSPVPVAQLQATAPFGALGINAPVPIAMVKAEAPAGIVSINAPIPATGNPDIAPPGKLTISAPVPQAIVSAVAPVGVVNITAPVPVAMTKATAPVGTLGLIAPTPNALILATPPVGRLDLVSPIPASSIFAIAPPGNIGLFAPVPSTPESAIAPVGSLQIFAPVPTPAVVYVGGKGAQATSVSSIPCKVGDLILVEIARGAAQAAGTPSGYTVLGSAVFATSINYMLCYKFATSTSESVPTASNAAYVIAHVYRNADVPVGFGSNNGTSATITWPTRTMSKTDGTSAYHMAGNHLGASNTHTTSLTGNTFGFVARTGTGAPTVFNQQFQRSWSAVGLTANISGVTQVLNASNGYAVAGVEIPAA